MTNSQNRQECILVMEGNFKVGIESNEGLELGMIVRECKQIPMCGSQKQGTTKDSKLSPHFRSWD